MKYVFKTEKFYWTSHIKMKMRFYGLSGSRLKRVFRKPDRKELGIAPRTVAVMQKAGTAKRPAEIWLMYQKKGNVIKMITAWRYPGTSPKRQAPPIPEEILWELKSDLKEEIPEEYVKGRVKFLNCEIDLTKRTFIPRPETEFWVKKTLKKIKGDDLKILDIFAGSGCIGIAILRACPERVRRIDFIDVDSNAIEQIRINLKLNKIPESRFNVLKSDLFEKLEDKKYDYIFANPPYVAEERLSEVGEMALEYEPQQALFSGKEGMDHIKKFLHQAKNFLAGNGTIYLEFDPLQKKDIENILKKEKYPHFRFFKDQFRKYRFAEIRKHL